MVEPKDKKDSGLVIAALLVFFVAAASGLMAGYIMAIKRDSTPAGTAAALLAQTAIRQAANPDGVAKAHMAEEGHPAEVSSAKLKSVLLIPVLTSIAYPSDKWIRLEAELLVREDVNITEAETHQIGDDFLSLLRTIELKNISSPSGFRFLRDDLLETANIRVKGRVQDIAIKTLVVE